MRASFSQRHLVTVSSVQAQFLGRPRAEPFSPCKELPISISSVPVVPARAGRARRRVPPGAPMLRIPLREWFRATPFIFMHLACLAVFWVEVTPTALILCAVAYFLRMFGLTAGYHRYFSHRTFKTSRWFQFVLAWLGCSAVQKGPLWWAGHHRTHHLYSDTEEDVHSPHTTSFLWSHLGWIIGDQHTETNYRAMRDMSRYPELRWLNRNHVVPGIVLAVTCFLIGGWPGLVWGFFVGTVILYHATFTINSLCHIFGTRRYPTNDLVS